MISPEKRRQIIDMDDESLLTYFADISHHARESKRMAQYKTFQSEYELQQYIRDEIWCRMQAAHQPPRSRM